MKNRFTSALLLWLCMCVTASSWAQTKKVVGHFHKKNGHTTKVVAKQKTATVNHDGRLFGKGKDALFNVAGPKKYTIRYGNRPRKTVGANDTTKSLQRKYNDAIISQLSKKQRKNDLKNVIRFANQFSKEVANKFETWIEIDNIRISDVETLALNAKYKNNAIDSYALVLTLFGNKHCIATVNAAGQFAFQPQARAYLFDDTRRLIALLRILNEYPITDFDPRIYYYSTTDPQNYSKSYYSYFSTSGDTAFHLDTCAISVESANYIYDSTIADSSIIDSASSLHVDPYVYFYNVKRSLLFSSAIVGGPSCNCGSFNKDSVLQYASESCYGCIDGDMLIYDAKCKQFWQYRNSQMRKVTRISRVHLSYNRQFKIKMIRLNRYLYNVNIGNSDIAFTSTESPAMQQLIPGSNNGQITPYNSFTDGRASNNADHFFDVIPGLRSSADKISNLADQYNPGVDVIGKFNLARNKYFSKQNIIYSINSKIDIIDEKIRGMNDYFKASNTGIDVLQDSLMNAPYDSLDTQSFKTIQRIQHINKRYDTITQINHISKIVFGENVIDTIIEDIRRINIDSTSVNLVYVKNRDLDSTNNSIGLKILSVKNINEQAVDITKELGALKRSLDVYFKSADYAYLPLNQQSTSEDDEGAIKGYIANLPNYKNQLTILTKKDTLNYHHKICDVDMDYVLHIKHPTVFTIHKINEDNTQLRRVIRYTVADSLSLLNLNKQVDDGKFWSYYTLHLLCDSFKISLDRFSGFYDSLLDKKINAYSICTNSMQCCGQNTVYTYSYFDAMLQNINKRYVDLRGFIKDTAHNEASKGFYKSDKAPSIDTITITDTLTITANNDTSHSKHPSISGKRAVSVDTLSISSSNVTIENNRITGLKLYQLQDTSKAKPKAAASPDPLTQMDSLISNFEKISPSDIMRIILFNNNMINSNISYCTVPIFPYGDRLGLTLQIGPSDSLATMGISPTSTETISFDFPVYGKPLLGFSGGTFAGLSNKFKTATYEWQQVPTTGGVVQTTSPYRLAKTGEGSLPIGLDGLVNVTWKLRSWFCGGISAGFGATAETQVRLAYLLGGTVSIGTYQQFHITYGASAMSVNVLKDDYVNNTSYYATGQGNVQYNQQMKIGGFLSFSYTLYSPKNTGSVQTGGVSNSGGASSAVSAAAPAVAPAAAAAPGH